MSSDIHILIVDDFPTMRRILKRHLTSFGFSRITEADNGRVAWEILNREPMDMVICDWDMPEMNGPQLLEKIRSHATMSQLPFIMVTAEEKGLGLVEPAAGKVTAYVPKPFKAADLETTINLVLGR